MSEDVVTPSPSGPIRWTWKKVAILIALLCLAAALFSAFNVGVSRKIGRLATVTNYDDVVYLNTASELYFQARRGQAAEAARTFLTSDTHSPVTVLGAILGYAAFGFSFYKVYHALALAVLVFLAYVAIIGRGLSGIYLGSLLLSALAIPLATMAALEFRPDPLWAIVLGGSCVLFLGAGNAFASWRPSVLFGLALGLALLTKPSTFAMTLLVFGGTWFLAAMIALAGRLGDFKRVALGLGLTLFSALVVCGWYCIPHAREIFDYFYVNSFGENKEVWKFPGTIWDRLLFYISGVSLQSNVGWLFLPLLATYLAGAIYDLVRGADVAARIRGGAFLWMLGCLYVVNGVFTMKSPFLGGSFYGFLIFGGIWYFVRLLKWSSVRDQSKDVPTRRRLQALTALAMVSTSWMAYGFPEVCKVNDRIATNQKTINRALVRDLVAKSASGEVTIMLTQGNPVVSEYLEMEFRHRGKPITVRNLAMMREIEPFIESAKKLRFVVLQDQNMIGSPSAYGIPGEKLQPELLDYFRKAPGWKEAAQYPTPGGKRVYLFEHVEP